jgi:Ni/Fe-hydrogenase subunit HybB-like protein
MWREETLSFWLEIGLFVIAPLVLLNLPKVRSNPQSLYWTCATVVGGFMANRLNVSITGLQSSAGIYYVPKWTEFAATLMVLTLAVLVFRYAVIYLDILPKNANKLPPQLRWTVRGAAAQA